jgi:hypothetical protein
MPIGDIYQLNIVGSVGKQYVENVLFFAVTTADVPDTPTVTAQDLITAFVGNVQISYLACLPTDYLLGGYKCKRVAPTGSNSIAQIDGVSAGTAGGLSVTSGQAPLCVFPEQTVGNPKRNYNTAKLFIPAMTAGTVIGDIIQPAFIAALRAFIAALVAPFPLGGGGEVAYGLYTRSNKSIVDIGDGTVSFTLGTQRRRLRPALG